MVIETRRDFLRQVALGLGVVCCNSAMGQPAEKAAYVGVETSAASRLSRASFFSPSGHRVASLPLDFRAHGLAEQGRWLVIFPRRPGNRFAVIDQTTLDILSVETAPENRHFFGHGAFTLDGRHLLVTENDLDSLRGCIGVYHIARRVRRVGQIEMSGAGPHEIKRHPLRDQFYIAVGGLETHPEYGRGALNLSEFRSQIVQLEFTTGRLHPLGYWPGSEGISLRHLAVDAKERLYVGGQVKDRERVVGHSVSWLVDGEKITRLDLDGQLKGYVSDVTAHGSHALISSKVTGAVLRLDGSQLIGQQQVEGASATSLDSELCAISGYRLLKINGNQTEALDLHEFDNHGLMLG